MVKKSLDTILCNVLYDDPNWVGSWGQLPHCGAF